MSIAQIDAKNNDYLKQSFSLLRFISGKPLIDANSISVPRFDYRLEGFNVRGFEDLRAKIPQFESIPSAPGIQLESGAARDELARILSEPD